MKDLPKEIIRFEDCKPSHKESHPQKHFGLKRVMEEADLSREEFKQKVVQREQFRKELKVERQMLKQVLKKQRSVSDDEDNLDEQKFEEDLPKGYF